MAALHSSNPEFYVCLHFLSHDRHKWLPQTVRQCRSGYFELFQMELDEGCSYSSVGHSEKSQEYILVLHGQLTLEIKDAAYVLKPNDSISFAASAKHTYKNSGEGILSAVIINHYPA